MHYYASEVDGHILRIKSFAICVFIFLNPVTVEEYIAIKKCGSPLLLFVINNN